MTKTLRLLKKHTLLLLTIFAVQGIFAQTIRYVNASVSGGSNNGTTWANAYKDLQPALAAAQTGDQIWVAKGTYYPTISTTDRTASFVMKNNLGIYGGFAGYETALNQRNWTTNVTTLSGDIDHATDPLVLTGSGSTLIITGNGGNSYNIIYNNHLNTTADSLNKTAILDGFTVLGGNANNNLNQTSGGGMENIASSPKISNIIFYGNSAFSGGGMYNYLNSPILTNIIFSKNLAQSGGGMLNQNLVALNATNLVFVGNLATFQGGGMDINYSYLIFGNCSFSGNSSGFGGGMAINSSTITLHDCMFSTNNSKNDGGGVTSSSSNLNLNNCLFSANTTSYDISANIGYGGGVYNSSTSKLSVANCIIWGNSDGIGNSGVTPLVTYSDIQGGYTGTGNINQDPQFVNATNPAGADGIFGTTDDGLALQSTSPCINKGSNAALPTGDTTDITGAARIQQGVVDMGAYENISCSASRIYVNGAAASTGDGSSWSTAYQYLVDAIHAANICSNIQEIWVAKGTYYPTNSTTDRTAVFTMKNNVAIYGGFVGTETLLTQRNWKNNVTTLSGDIDHATDPLVVTGSGSTLSITGDTGNSYHVLYGNNLNKTAILDGFAITGGNATGMGLGPIIQRVGGGFYNGPNSSPTLANLVFSGNNSLYAGGMVNDQNCSPSLVNVVFERNYAIFSGGGMNNNISSPSLSNVLFSGNYGGNNFGGGGINNIGSSPTLANVTFSGNYAQTGGDIYNDGSSTSTITNSIIWGNSAGIYNLAGGNTIISYSNIQGGYTGIGNINQIPLFVNAANPAGADGVFGTADDGLTLQSTSPCINKGSNAAIPAGITTDIAGLPRLVGGTVDMGAYESGYTTPIPTAFTGCPNVNLAIARQGYNTYNGEPVNFYNIDTTTGAATIIVGGPLKDPGNGILNMNVNAVGLNSQDGFLYAIKDTITTRNGIISGKYSMLLRIGSNYISEYLGTITPPSLMQGENMSLVNPAAGGFDDQGNYYYIGVSGSTSGNSFTPSNYYIGKISNANTLQQSYSNLTPTYTKIDFSALDCSDFATNLKTTVTATGLTAWNGISDIVFSNVYKKLYLYTSFQSPMGSGNYKGQLLGINSNSGIATCYTAIPTLNFANSSNEVAGISSTTNGSLLVLFTGGDMYKTVMTPVGDFTGAVTKMGASGIASLAGQTGSIRGDLASCGFGKALSNPGIIIPQRTELVGYPNPAHSFVTLSANHTLSNATVRLVTLSGNVISEQTGVSGSTFKMDLSRGASGIYMVEIIEATGSSRMKIIKE